MKKIIFIGNGILSLMSALRIVQREDNSYISIIGPFSRDGCASVAAPAMLNSFAELVKGSLDTDIDREKFKISRLAGKKWRNLFDDMEEFVVQKPQPAFGTYVLNNATTDKFDDENFDAIIDYLNEFDEEFELVTNDKIPGYNPSSQGRALRALFIKNEGFVNSERVLDYLVDYLKHKGVTFIDESVTKLIHEDGVITSLLSDSQNYYKAEYFFLSPGANFSKIIEKSNLNLKMQKILYGSGVAVELEPKEMTLSNCVRTPNRGMACGVYSAPRTENTIFVGASNLIADYGLKHGMVTSIESLLKSAMEQINTSFYNAGFVGTKVGWRPTSEDTYPLIGATSIPNLIVATGTKRDGFHMSPIISEYLISLLYKEDYEHSHLFDYFKPEREIIRNISREKAIQDIVAHQISAMYQHDFVPPKSNMLNDFIDKLTVEANEVHDKVGAKDWGIPPELYAMYKGGYLASSCAG